MGMKTLLKLLIPLLALGLIAAACGNDDDDSASDDAAATATEAAPAEESSDEAMDDEAMDDEAMAEGTIVETAVAAGDFTTLVAAVEAAGLVETLEGPGPFTVFAPTDEAFAAALEALDVTAEELLADPDLAAILTYHVVPGEVLAADVVGLDGEMVETVNGAAVEITVTDDGMVMVNEATVVTTDVQASNGVIHVIDAVLLPPS